MQRNSSHLVSPRVINNLCFFFKHLRVEMDPARTLGLVRESDVTIQCSELPRAGHCRGFRTRVVAWGAARMYGLYIVCRLAPPASQWRNGRRWRPHREPRAKQDCAIQGKFGATGPPDSWLTALRPKFPENLLLGKPPNLLSSCQC